MDVVTLALAKKYTEETVIGLGALKGAPCTIKSIEENLEGFDVIFEWTANDGVTKQTQTIQIENGTFITDIDVDENNYLICTLSNGKKITSIHPVMGFNEEGGSSILEKDIVCNISVGNASAGTTLPRGMTFTEYAEKVHVATLAPSVVINTPISTIKEYGEVITTLPIKATITKKTYPISKVDFYDNNTNINTVTSIPSNGIVTMDYSCNTNDKDMKIKVTATDAGGLSGSASVDIKYSRGIFYGTNLNNVLYNTSALVRELDNKLLGKGKGTTFTIDIPAGTKTVVIAVPATMSLSDIKFRESMNMGVLSTFNVSQVDVEGANKYAAIGYKVYQYTAPTTFSQLSHYDVII